ncbi:MAG: universal stress protein [Gemmatimonadota bacterium]
MIQRILVPLDGSTLAECVLPHVAAIASAHEAETIFLNVVHSESGTPDPINVDLRLRRAEAACYLEEKAAALQARNLPVDVVVLEGRPAEQIRDFARRESIDLIVVSDKGEGGSALRLGAVAQKVVSGGDTSILLVRAASGLALEFDDPYRRIMVPVDGSPLADWALCLAGSIARELQADLLIVFAVEIPDMPRRLPPAEHEAEARRRLVRANRRAARRYLDDMKRKLEGERLRVRTRLVVTDNVPKILHKVAEEEDVDLIVASAHGASGDSEWEYGSVATNLITYGRKPLLVFQDASQVRARVPSEVPSCAELHGPVQLMHNGAGG